MITKDSWSPAEGLTLETNALYAARETKRCVMLTAGPGSGKTEVLAQRADFLLRTGVCRYPKRILAISFKVDASRNLKDRVRQRSGISLTTRFDSYTFHAFSKHIIDIFRPVLTGDDALDADYKIGIGTAHRKQIEFKHLVPLAIKILKNSSIARNAICMTYSDVFMDEFQDCTDEQYELIKLAFLGTSVRLTAVGDSKQKIMGWAGALDGIFQTFINDFSAHPLNLYRNFRSEPRLLRMQNAIIKVIDSNPPTPEDQDSGKSGIIFQWNFKNSEQEAKTLAESIHSWIEKEHMPPSEIAILIRSKPDLYIENLTKELKLRGIPYRDEQKLQDISTEPLAKLIIDYLSVLYGQREPGAWSRLMTQLTPFDDSENSHKQESSRAIQIFINEQLHTLKSEKSNETQFSDSWNSVRHFLNKVGRDSLSSLSYDYDSMDRLRQVINDTKTRIEELLSEGHSLPDALKLFSDDKAVRILTIHKSKGLEFDTVIILGVEQETFFNKNKKDELCAFFVGISRAKRRLILTVCEERPKPSAATGRWDVRRTPHTEFLSYASPYLCKDQC